LIIFPTQGVYKTKMNSMVKQIIENIHNELISSELSNNIGLHGGTSGIALFLAYYERIIHNSQGINPKIMEILEHNIRMINSGRLIHTICNGISGFGWLCEHLAKMEMLYREDIEFLDELDSFLYNKMITDIKRGTYDFLHGALGVGTYFLTRFGIKDVRRYLNDLLFELEKSAILCENGAVKWMSILDVETRIIGYNISLSHGLSSIAAFLIRLIQVNFETERAKRLLNGTITYIVDQITYTKGCISYFPSHSKESSTGSLHSRLGWCYGDLGIACVIRNAAVVLNNHEWEEIALKVLRFNCNRRNLDENGIRDASLCHGSAGIAHIYLNLYSQTMIDEFKETADYWHNITLQMAKYPDGLAGYKYWRGEKHGGYENCNTLLEGVAGIGLALLSYIGKSNISWDDCLMLT